MIYRILLFLILSASIIYSQSFPDQFFSYKNDSLMARIDSLAGTEISQDGKRVILSGGVSNGFIIFKPDSSEYYFNRGLPSWNGHAPSDRSSFRVLMRFYNHSWSSWLTVGYWKTNLWSSYGTTSYGSVKIDIDNAVMSSYYKKWQFKVEMKRTSADEPSPEVWKLSFFVSDQRTTDNVNINSIVNDNPEQIFIPTQHYYQYALDPNIGGDICSPTSTAMVLRSYNIEVDPLKFARDNYDNYWRIFGIWPRTVQNAEEFDLDGSVTRYRTWSQAREVLANGGRIVMSVSYPLYAGHLIMLAGFDSNGNPLVHDPARSDGYGYKFNKTALSQSWFNKGGVAYTFYLADTAKVTSVERSDNQQIVDDYNLSIFPNPFNPQTNIVFETKAKGYAEITVFDITGRKVETLFKGELNNGIHKFKWDASALPSGMYFIRSLNGSYTKTVKALLVK